MQFFPLSWIGETKPDKPPPREYVDFDKEIGKVRVENKLPIYYYVQLFIIIYSIDYVVHISVLTVTQICISSSRRY